MMPTKEGSRQIGIVKGDANLDREGDVFVS